MAASIEGPAIAGLIEGIDTALPSVDPRAAIPTHTTTMAATNAVATIFKWVVASALLMEEFMIALIEQQD